MKRMIATAMVLVLASLFTIQAQSRVISSKKVYSLDKYDGYMKYARGGIQELYLNNSLQATYGSGLTNEPFVTFDLSQIDLDQAKSITLHLSRKSGPKNIEIMVEPWHVNDQDYAHWQQCNIWQWGNAEKVIRPRHEPQGCGFATQKRIGPYLAPKAEFPGWYEVIRYQDVNWPDNNFFMEPKNRHNKTWHSTDLTSILQKNFSDKKYVTFGFYPRNKPKELHSSLEMVRFADGNPLNTVFRPYLEVTY